VLQDFTMLGWFVRKRSRILFSLLGFSCSCSITLGLNVPKELIPNRHNLPWLSNKDKKMIRKKHRLFQRAKSTMIILWSDIPGIVLQDFTKFGWFVRKRSRILFSLLGFSCSLSRQKEQKTVTNTGFKSVHCKKL
jgi:hypothetical protein